MKDNTENNHSGEYADTPAGKRLEKKGARGKYLAIICAVVIIGAAGMWLWIPGTPAEGEFPEESWVPVPDPVGVPTPGIPQTEYPQHETNSGSGNSSAGKHGGYLVTLELSTSNPGDKPASKPVVGMERYAQFLERAAVIPATESEGTVRVTFRVNQYGRPSGMKIEERFSQEAGREAVRLLDSGPEWTPTSAEERVEVLFRFTERVPADIEP